MSHGANQGLPLVFGRNRYGHPAVVALAPVGPVGSAGGIRRAIAGSLVMGIRSVGAQVQDQGIQQGRQCLELGKVYPLTLSGTRPVYQCQ